MKSIFKRENIVIVMAIGLQFVLGLSSAGQDQYKRVHQRALQMITGNSADAAIEYLDALAQQRPNDAETQFMLSLAYAQVDQVESAVACMRKAIDLGLPPGRFIAGPRDLLQPIHGTAAFKTLLAGNRHVPVHGPMIGAVTDSAASIWVRTALADPVEVIVRPDDSDGETMRFRGNSTAETDFTVVIRATGLTPDTMYQFEIEIGGKRATSPVRGQFRTAPHAGRRSRFTLAFGGGAGYVPQHERMWQTIGQFQPRLLLLLGDNVYIDQPESSQMQKYCYYRRQSRSEFSQLVTRTPVYSIWDDHDFGTNDCWGGPDPNLPPWKRSVWDVFRQNWVNPGYGGGVQKLGCWYAFSVGDVDFIMLDGRCFRTDPRQPEPTMLGPVQKAWLKEQLRRAKGTFKVLCSPVPWDFRTKGTSRDTWNGFRKEREEIFAFIEQHRITGVVLMSADRHRSDAWQIKRPHGYDLFEFNSSRLTNQHLHPTMERAIFSYNQKQSFGLVTFDTTVDDPIVVYKVVSIDGEIVHELTLKHSQLNFH